VLFYCGVVQKGPVRRAPSHVSFVGTVG